MVYNGVGIIGYISLGFLADAVGRKPVTMLFYLMGVVMTPVLFLWTRDIHVLLVVVGINGFFTLGLWAWAPIWLPELFPTRMRGTAVAFTFNAPRLVACVGPLIAGSLIVSLGGYGYAATIVGMFYLLGLVAAPFLPETKGRPLPEIT
jgi:MFS family permease